MNPGFLAGVASSAAVVPALGLLLAVAPAMSAWGLLPHAAPRSAQDVTPPQVTVTSPNGGETWTGGAPRSVTWTATDDSIVASVDVFYRDGESEPWTLIARGLPNTGSFTWFVHNTPTAAARVRVLARDGAGNPGEDQSDGTFTIERTPGGAIPTTLRDFHQPGTQPFQGGTFLDIGTCGVCHGHFSVRTEPLHNTLGGMMSQSARDPLFRAALAIAEQDAPSSGDFCLRCHAPMAWLQGRSLPADGSRLTSVDREGVGCHFCHRLVDPIYVPGVSPAEDVEVLGGLLPGHVPSTYSNGQFVVDPDPRRRGPLSDPFAPHFWIESPFHRSADFCGTCHDVSNPVFVRTGVADYAPGPFDHPPDSIGSLVQMPLHRTYSEWKNSAYPAGVYAPDFAGTKPDGIVSKCQDCHLSDINGYAANELGVPYRRGLSLHDMTGGSSWLGPLMASLYPAETDPGALADGSTRARVKLGKAATLGIAVEAEGDSFRAAITIKNNAGHKLPTGFPEARRIWLHVVARDDAGQVVYESGAYDPATGVLAADPALALYEARLGLSPSFASATGRPPGPSFHLALADTVYKDTRIPPLGFTNTAYAAFGGAPLDPDRPGQRYADGQNWDVPSYGLPRRARRLTARLLYQSMSKEYVEFLRDQNTTNSTGQDLYDLWSANGRSAPVVMKADSVQFAPVGAPEPVPGTVALRLGANPFRGGLEMSLELDLPARVLIEVFDVAGRRVTRDDRGTMGAGVHPLAWEGGDAHGRDAGSGAFWLRVRAGEREWVRRIVRLR